MAKAKGFLEGSGEIASAVGGIAALAGAVPSIANAFLRKTIEPDRVLIFDDLERSNLKLKDVLGAIQSYINQLGFCVIVIAHDKKMAKKFSHIKEKSFGQTIRVTPQIDDAINSFLKEIKDTLAKTFIETHRNAILEVFKSSKISNLRTLRHVVHDMARLHSTLTPTHLNNTNAMLEMVHLFTAFDIETRENRLDKKALQNRRGVSSGYYIKSHSKTKSPPNKPKLMVANERYPAIDMEGGLLNDDTLVAMFIHGSYPPDDIRGALDRSHHFIKPNEDAPWRVVISFDRLDDNIVDTALEKMEQQFTDRSVTIPGEMLHIFALKMMMAEHVITEHSVREVVGFCKAYIDDLLQDGNLPPRGVDWRWSRSFEHAHEGQGYWVSDANKPDFKVLFDYLISQMEAVFDQQAPEIAADLLKLMQTDPKHFFEQISPTNNGENPYAYISLLHHIPAKDFVKAWVAAPKGNWREIYYAIENRYGHGTIDRELNPERVWVIEVYKCLKDRVKNAEGFMALRIERVIPNALRVIANEDIE